MNTGCYIWCANTRGKDNINYDIIVAELAYYLNNHGYGFCLGIGSIVTVLGTIFFKKALK